MDNTHEHTLKIGLIDSAFDIDDIPLRDGIKIICSKKNTSKLKDNNHANKIIDIILNELKSISKINIEIHVFPILNYNNQG